MDGLSRPELLEEIDRRDELIEQLQNELRGMRIWQMQAERREHEMAEKLAKLEEQRGIMNNGGSLIVPGGPIQNENMHQPICAQFSDSQLKFTHARKIEVSAESSRYLHKEQQQMEQAKQQERNGNRRWSKQMSREKDPGTLEILRSAILSNEFLCQLESDEIAAMIQGMRPADVQSETTIVKQGELSNELFVLQEGRVQVSRDQRFIRIMESPCVFGELAILYNCERTATVIALTHCRLWSLHRTAFHTIMVTHAKSRQQQNFNHLKRCAQLGELLDDGQLMALAGKVREEFWQFRTEMDENQLQGRIYLITKGRITLRRRPLPSDSPPELLVLSVGTVIGLHQLFDSIAIGKGQIGTIKGRNSPSQNTGMGQSQSALAQQQQQGMGNRQIKKNISRSDTSNSSSKGSRQSSLTGCNSLLGIEHQQNQQQSSYFVDSVEGCTLLAMLVEQIQTKPSTNNLEHGNVEHHHQGQNDDEGDGHSIEGKEALGHHRIGGLVMDDGQGSSGSGDEDRRSEDNVGIDEEFDEVELADLKTVATLGVGGFGRVNLVRHFDTERVYALKILNKRHIKEMNQIEHVQNERNILLDCRSNFIVRLYKTFRDSERLYMLMEYCPGGEVWTMLRNWGRFDEPTARYYCAAALEAFDYLHRRLIIYRDLKPENMLLDMNGTPKLVDFGFAKRLANDGAKAWTFCGTAEYVAPEVILNKGQDCAVDLWSLGIFMFELISGSPPFASTDPMHTYNSILKGVQLLAWPRYMSENARALICKFCRRDPSQRLGYGRIEDARQDVWFKGFDFAAFRNQTMRPPIRPKIRSLTDTQNFDRYPSTDNFACGSDESGWDEEF